MTGASQDDRRDSGATERLDDLLLKEVRLALERVGAFSALPTQPVATLVRTSRGLGATTDDEIDWKALTVMLAGTPAVWEHVGELAEALSDEEAVELDIGWAYSPEQRAVALWNNVISPILECYGHRGQGDRRWNPELAREVVDEWRGLHGPQPIRRQTIAPLHNLHGLSEPVTIGARTVIRPMTDDDRSHLWRHFGGVGPITHLTPEQFDAWTHVIDDRWTVPRQERLDAEDATLRRIRNIVTALRLHHPGVTGTTLVWTRPDPPDAPISGTWGTQSLVASDGAWPPGRPLRTDVGIADGPALQSLVEKLSPAREDRRTALALRRFDSAYDRHNREDALIDLWIAFEALVVPDGTAELSYRAALRIGRLAGQTAEERWNAFRLARESYKMRSRVVHGEEPRDSLDKMVEDTRHLARVVLKGWLLQPPSDIQDLDRGMLA